MFSSIYLGNLSPAEMAGYRGSAAGTLDKGVGKGRSVDNFFMEKISNDFNAQVPKSRKSILFIDFRPDWALFQCPAQQGVKQALQAVWPTTSTQRRRAGLFSRCRAF